MRLDRRFGRIVAALCVLFLWGGILEAKSRKGDRFLAAGHVAEQRKEWDKALEWYERALAEDPGDVAYQIAVRRVRFQAAQAHIDAGQKLRKDGKLDEALAELQKAYAIDPSSSIAEQELRRTLSMIERNRKAGASLDEKERALTPAELARKRELEKIQSIQGVPELKPLSPQAINLRMQNQPPKVLYETIGKLAGVSVVLDPDFKMDANASRTFSLELTNSTLDEALDTVASMTRTFWKPLSSNTIFVTSENQAKRRDFEDQVVKVFYLQNLTTPQELTEISTILRTVADIRRVFTYGAQNALILRGSPDQVALAEKLVYDMDRPKSEVVVDVIVMEANKAKSRDLAAAVASNGTAGLSSQIQFTPRNPVLLGANQTNNTTTTTDDTTTDATQQQILNLLQQLAANQNSLNNLSGLGNNLSNLSNLTGSQTQQQQLMSLARIAKISTNDFSVTLPGALLQFLMTDRATKVLQSPQVRAAHGQKASLRIGDKVPIVSGGIQPFGGTGGAGGFGGGLYNQTQFIDVGVNVDVTPTVHGTEEVTLKVELEISNVRDRVDLGGISQPIIGQRKVTHEIRIKEGEVSLLGGLMQEQETKSISGIPGLGSIPLLRRLFTSESTTKDQSELLIALIPHIVRTPDINDVNLKSIAAGTEAVVKLSYAAKQPAPQPPSTPPGAPAPMAPPPAAPGAPAPGAPAAVVPVPGAPAPGTPPAGTAPAPAPGPAAPPAPGSAQAAPPTPLAPGAGQPQVMFRPSPQQAQSGSTFTVQLDANNMVDLFAAPLLVRFDPQFVRLAEVTPGQLLAGDGQRPVFTRNIMNDTGELRVNLSRMPGRGGISGSGTLLTLTFQALKPGTTTVAVPEFAPKNSQAQPIQAGVPHLTVNIK